MFILFDIGGTNTRIAGSTDLKRFGKPIVFKTPNRFEDGMSLFAENISKLSNGKKIKAIAGGIAGALDKDKTKLVNTPNIGTDWIKKPIQKELSRIANAPAYIENDTSVVGLGEMHQGAGRGYKIGAYITVSTGVGGARFVDGKIDVSTFGFEPGHQIISFDGSEGADNDLKRCEHCYSAGHLEGYVSGTAVKRRYGKEPSKITDKETWDDVARLLSYGLNNTIVHWSPEVLVLGGSMITKSPGISLARVKYHLKRTTSIFPTLPDIKKAKLGDLGGLHGATVYLSQIYS